MTAPLLPELAPWFAAVFALCALVAALGAAASRALFAVVAGAASASALAAAALAALVQAPAALALGLFGAGLAPVLLLNTLALTVRTAPRARARLSWIAGGALWALVAALVQMAAASAPAPPAPQQHAPAMLAVCIAGLALVSGVVVLALVGSGERSAAAETAAEEGAAR